MGKLVIVAYRPRDGMEETLMKEVKDHVPILRGEGLATDREAYVMRAADGTLIEVFEWKSAEAIDRAHKNPAVQAMWTRFEAACEYVKLADLKESGDLFATFEPADV